MDGNSPRKTMLPTLRRLSWLGVLALAGIWFGLAYIPGIEVNWLWLGRAAIFFIGAALIWFSYDFSEDTGA